MWFRRYPRGQTDTQTDRQTDRHRQTYSLQYFTTAPAGEVTSHSTDHSCIITLHANWHFLSWSTANDEQCFKHNNNYMVTGWNRTPTVLHIAAFRKVTRGMVGGHHTGKQHVQMFHICDAQQLQLIITWQHRYKVTCKHHRERGRHVQSGVGVTFSKSCRNFLTASFAFVSCWCSFDPEYQAGKLCYTFLKYNNH